MDNKHRIKKKFRVNLSFSPSVASIVAHQTQLGKRFGLMGMTPPPPDLLFDPRGEEVKRRNYQWGQRAGLESGRYLFNRNQIFMKNYETALNSFPDTLYWKYTIERLKMFIKEKQDLVYYADFLADIFPPLNDWYPSNKGYTRGKQITYKDSTKIDVVSRMLRSDIDEALDIYAIKFPKFDEKDLKLIAEGKVDLPPKYLEANKEQIEKYKKENNIE